MKKGLALLLTGLLAVTSIPAAAVDIGEVDMTKGTTDWNNPESYVYNNDTGVPDKGLYEAVVRDGGGSDGLLTVAEAEALGAFANNYSTDTTINSLKGLEHFKSLQSIWIYNDPESDSYTSGVTDLSPLKDLEYLWELQLLGNPDLTDLSPLENLNSLYALYLRDAVKIQDFSPLKNTNIARLDIRGTNSTHPSLHDSTNLFDTVKQMGKLYWLELTGFVISDADSMLELPGLSVLGLWDCEFESKLPQLPNLESLYIRDSNLTNLNGIGKLPKLNSLYLTKNKQLTTLDEIDKLPKLSSLFFEENKQLTTLPDLSGSSELTLESLHFSNNQLSAEELTAKLPKRLQELPEWPEWLKNNADDLGEPDEPSEPGKPEEPGEPDEPGNPEEPDFILPKPGAQEDGSYVVNLDQPEQNDGHRFSVRLPEGMVDESKELTLKVTPQTTSSAAVKTEAEKENCEIQHGFDLSLEYTDGTKVKYTPGKLMAVWIYSPDIIPGRAYRIFRENDDGSVDVIIPSYVGHGIMQFKTDHFSHYSWGIVKNAPVVPDRPSRPSGSSGGSCSYSSRIDENWIFVRSQGMGSVTPGDCTVYDGEDKTFTFMPDEGYKVGKVLLDGEEIPTDGKSYTLRDITAPHTLTVIFARDTADEASKPVDPVKPNVTENAQTGDAWWKLW